MAKTTKTTKTKANKAENVGIGVTEAHLTAITKLLQAALADEHVLYIKTRNFHWNVEGMSFGPLHILFEQQYTQLETIIDDIAERIRKLGFYAAGSLKSYLEMTHLQEHTAEGTKDRQMIELLMKDHEAVIRFLRESIDKIDDDYGDTGTADALTGIMEQHEKIAWMLRAHLK